MADGDAGPYIFNQVMDKLYPKRNIKQQPMEDEQAQKMWKQIDAELLFGKPSKEEPIIFDQPIPQPHDYRNAEWMYFCEQRRDSERAWNKYFKRKQEVADSLMEQIKQVTMEAKFIVDTKGGQITIECPPGWDVKKNDDGTYTAFPRKQKDLEYWWVKYGKERRLAFPSNPLSASWRDCVDFYRWLAAQINDDAMSEMEEWDVIYYDTNGDRFRVDSYTELMFSPIRHTRGTAQQVIDILGDDLLKKIFQIK
jgi:hypothetical protein